MLRIPRAIVVNTICCGCGALLAWDLWWVLRYRNAFRPLWEGVLRCFGDG